ncbi:MAG: Rieske (2Fe-2S) protein [Terrimesophilobacter sp.]
MTNPSRRALITTGTAAVLGAGAVILTGCAPIPPTRGPGPGPNPRPRSSASPGVGANQTPPDVPPSASPLPPGTALATVTQIPVGGTSAVTVDGQNILLARPKDAEVVAFSAICTHEGCLVSAVASEFECFCHGSRFAAATGAVLKGPARRALEPVPVSVSGGSVVTA